MRGAALALAAEMEVVVPAMGVEEKMVGSTEPAEREAR